MVTTPEQTAETVTLDQALVALRQDMANPKSQSKFYDIFLNTDFLVPTLDPEELEGAAELAEGESLPLIIEADGHDYLMIFDSEDRLKGWAGEKAKWVPVPGHVLAATTMPPLHMAMNVGTEYSKQFHPDEIAWLREVVEQCNQAAKEQE